MNKIRFQADADLHPAIRNGVLRREPSIDFQPASGVFPDATHDLEVLRIAAESGRVLITRDVRTMRTHFDDFIQRAESPGVILIPSSRSIGSAIEGLLIVWRTAAPEDLRNRVQWLP